MEEDAQNYMNLETVKNRERESLTYRDEERQIETDAYFVHQHNAVHLKVNFCRPLTSSLPPPRPPLFPDDDHQYSYILIAAINQ